MKKPNVITIIAIISLMAFGGWQQAVAQSLNATVINHVPTPKAIVDYNGTEYDISCYNSMSITDILNRYMDDETMSEGHVFYLEGGKAYHTDQTSVSIYKGFTLRTNPEDLAQGKRAILYQFSTSNTSSFMLGRTASEGETGSEVLKIGDIRFMDLDIDCPLAVNYGGAQEGLGSVTGNYFMNMYSAGLAVDLTLLEWNNCTFQHFIRGFFRMQGSNNKHIHQIKLIDSDFSNCGYFSSNGTDYGYIYADMNGNASSNVLENVEISGCTFYNSPKSPLITDGNRNLMWDESVRWNIDVHHNTFVNYNTVSTNRTIMNTRYIPGGSLLGFHDNLIILTKNAQDENRAMNGAGWDARNVQGGDNSGKCTFNIYNNWTTDDPYLTQGQPFNSNAFSASSNAPGKWSAEYHPHGIDELTVHCETGLSANDLMLAPNPKHFIGSTASHLDFETDNLEWLRYFNTDKVKNSQIYKLQVGAAKWRENMVEKEPIMPVIEPEVVSFSEGIDGNTDLSDNVVDNTYYNMNAEKGDGYNAETQSLVLNSTMTDEQMNAIQNAKIGDEAISENFNGIIIEVAAGKGTVKVDVQTNGSHKLNVQIGKEKPAKATRAERGKVSVPYNVTEPTYVYIYASSEEGSKARLDRTASAATNSVLLYGYEVTPGVSYILGDANNDELVNVTDIVATVNYIMEKPSEGFNKAAADLNGDGEINVTDIVKMVSIIMSGDAARRDADE